jgi:hypothetical protein
MITKIVENENIYTLKDFLNEGKGKNLKIEDVDPEQLQMGIQVEKEHTSNNIIAQKIAMDHLAEISDYYTRLSKMEEEANKE